MMGVRRALLNALILLHCFLLVSCYHKVPSPGVIQVTEPSGTVDMISSSYTPTLSASDRW